MIRQEEQINAAQSPTLEERRSFLRLPLEERRRRLAEQAEIAAAHYEHSSAQEERAEWQGGDVIEY